MAGFHLALDAGFPLVIWLALLCKLDMGEKEAEKLFGTLALPVAGGRVKEIGQVRKASTCPSEAPKASNPVRCRSLKLSTSSAGGTLGVRGTKSSFFIASLFKSFSNHLTYRQGRLQLFNFSVFHKHSER